MLYTEGEPIHIDREAKPYHRERLRVLVDWSGKAR